MIKVTKNKYHEWLMAVWDLEIKGRKIIEIVNKGKYLIIKYK